MFKEAFQKLNKRDTKKILKRLNDHLKGEDFDIGYSTALSIDLPFYHGYELIEVTDNSSHPPRKISLLSNDNFLQTVEYSSQFIYQNNGKLGLYLDKDNLSEYIHFFFTHAVGSQGRFLIIENIEDIPWKESPPPNAKNAISKMITPLTLKEEHKKNGFIVKATMVFKTTLFSADIVIKPNGTIVITNEEMLVEEMPILDDTLGY